MGFNKKDNAYKALNIGKDRVDENAINQKYYQNIAIGSNAYTSGSSTIAIGSLPANPIAILNTKK